MLSLSVFGWQITASGTATNLLSSPIPIVYFSTLDPDLKNESYNANMINICGKYCTDPEMYYVLHHKLAKWLTQHATALPETINSLHEMPPVYTKHFSHGTVCLVFTHFGHAFILINFCFTWVISDFSSDGKNCFKMAQDNRSTDI